eukprot:scaffold168867_cov24-Tisochrysis_lutea.AAC.3
MELDLTLRVRVHCLEEALKQAKVCGCQLHWCKPRAPNITACSRAAGNITWRALLHDRVRHAHAASRQVRAWRRKEQYTEDNADQSA